MSHAVAAEERNIIWKATNGIFRPVKTDARRAAERDAARRGRRLPDARSGHPTHTTNDPFVPAPRQRELAGELGYTEEVPPGRTSGAKQPVFHNPNGQPPYISYDLDGHGAATRGADGPVRIPWKGADSPTGFGGRERLGTFNPVFDDSGNIVFQRGRR